MRHLHHHYTLANQPEFNFGEIPSLPHVVITDRKAIFPTFALEDDEENWDVNFQGWNEDEIVILKEML